MQPQQRDYAKQLAYGLLYFKGAHALAVDLSCDVKQAARHHESFMQSIPDVVSHTEVTRVLGFNVVNSPKYLEHLVANCGD